MSVWIAVLWGGFSSGSLFVGEALARPLEHSARLTGLIMGFGAGTLLSAIAYELVPRTAEGGADVWRLGLYFAVGALAYYVGDRLVDEGGGAKRQEIVGGGGSGAAMFIGALLDGIPEAFVLGITLALGGSVSVAFVTAVFVSNIPQGIAGTTSLRAAGSSDRRIVRMWSALTLACALTAALGFALADSVPHQGTNAEAFAAGAILTMLANSMMPEAFEHGGRLVGLVTVLGFLVSAVLAVAQ